MPLLLFDTLEDSTEAQAVTLNTEQIVSGLKTFSQIRLQNPRVRPPITGTEAALLFFDSVSETGLTQTGDL